MSRVAVLAVIAALSASAAMAVASTASRTTAGYPARCLLSGQTIAIDTKIARLIAPVTTVRLAHARRVHPALAPTRFVFPLLGHYAVPSNFGSGRAGLDWHHGDDLFASRGTPVVAVTSGVVFSVGWQNLGGHRLWLRDAQGNEFYYAHLARYATAAHNGAIVRAGQVLGYVGTSGDAEHTPPHLHFEVHPKPLLRLGYDGAVDPTTYLARWQQIDMPTLPAKPSPAPTCGP